jgi:hypothetical protein
MATPDAPSQPICPLGVSERTLSALRDEAVSRAEADPLAAHIETCPACTQRLAAFDDLAASLRSERVPEPDERLWQAIVAAGSPSRSLPLRWPSLARVRLPWSRLSALAAVLLLTVGFLALFGLHRPSTPVQPTPTATLTPAPSPTATPGLLPAHPLTWQPIKAIPQNHPVAFAGDGQSGYMCNVGFDAQGNGSLSIWHTSDRGADWIPARIVPTDPSMDGCELVVDASDPSVAALAWQPRGGGAGDSYTGRMTTVDGGVTWQATPWEPYTQINQLDSSGGVIYALRETVDSGNAVESHLWASADRMRSWRQVDHGLPPYVSGFWLQPDGTGILIVQSGAPDASPSLWTSPDDGATWQQLDVPGGVPTYWAARGLPFGMPSNDIAARSLQGQFHICVWNAAAGTSTGASTQPSPAAVTCSTDSGATWHARAQGASVANSLLAIANDGALLATGPDGLYRLGANTDRWQSLGPLPGSSSSPKPGLVYCPSPGAGMLWAVSLASNGPGDPQPIFTASYTP